MDKGYKLSKSVKKAVFGCNPLLVLGLGFSPAVISAHNLKLALGISAFTLVSVVISALVVSLLRDYMSQKSKIVLLVVISAGIALMEQSVAMAFAPSLVDEMNIMFPFVSFNSFVILFSQDVAMKHKTNVAVISAFLNGIGFSLALCILASAREVISNGTLFGINVLGERYYGSYFISHPAGIIILAGAIAAVFKAIGNIKIKGNGEDVNND